MRKFSISRLSRAFSVASSWRYSRVGLLVELLRVEQRLDERAHRGERRLQFVRDRRDEIVLQTRELHLPAKAARDENASRVIAAMTTLPIQR